MPPRGWKGKYKPAKNGRRKKGVAQKALTLANKNAAAIKRQRSNFDIRVTEEAIPTVALFTLLNGIPRGDEGTADGERVGNTVSLNTIKIKGLMQINAAENVSSQLRVMLVWDKVPNNAEFEIGTLLTVTTNPAKLFTAMRDDATKRFRVLSDRLFSLGKNGPQSKIYNYSKKFSAPLVSKFSTGGDEINAIETGALYLVAFSNSAVETVNFSFDSRVYYEI